MVTGGYAGFYKGMFLRSSYEYVYCKILEFEKIKFKVEEKTYTLDDGSKYKPDFHLYTNKNKLFKIVEIKSGRKSDIEKNKKQIKLLQKLLPDIEIVVLFIKELRILCNNANYNFYKLSEEWKHMAKGRNINKGELNPMYNNKHSKQTKSKIGTKSKERWQDPKFRELVIRKKREFFENGGTIGGYIRTERITMICPHCKQEFTKLPSSKKIFCSKKCSSNFYAETISKQVKERNSIKHKKILLEINHAVYNTKIDVNTISRTTLYTIARTILITHGFNDIRTFKFIVTGKFNNNFKVVLGNFKPQYFNYLKYMPNLHDDKV